MAKKTLAFYMLLFKIHGVAVEDVKCKAT